MKELPHWSQVKVRKSQKKSGRLNNPIRRYWQKLAGADHLGGIGLKRYKKEKRIIGLKLCYSGIKRLNERLHIHAANYSLKARPLPIETNAKIWIPCCLTLSTRLPFYTTYPANIYLLKGNNKYVKIQKTFYQDFDYIDAVFVFQ